MAPGDRRSASGKKHADKNRQLREQAVEILRRKSSTSQERSRALKELAELGRTGLPAILLVVAALNDRLNRRFALSALIAMCPDFFLDNQELKLRLAEVQGEARVDAIRDLVRMLPEVEHARLAGVPGWAAVRELLDPAVQRKEALVTKRKRPAQEGQEKQEIQRGGVESAKQEKSIAPSSLSETESSVFEGSVGAPRRESSDPVTAAMAANPGCWIVWDEAARIVFAISDEYDATILGALKSSDPNIMVDVAPGARREEQLQLLDWESPDVVSDVKLLWGSTADAFLDAPNPRFDWRRPRDLVGTNDERLLRWLLRAVKDGITA